MSTSTHAHPVWLPRIGVPAIHAGSKRPVRRVLVFGHLGMGNVGDEAMLPGVLRSIRRQWPNAEVVIAAGDHRSPLVGEHSYIPRTLKSLLRAMWRCDAFVLAGGTHLASFRDNRQHTRGILRHLIVYRLAKLLGLRVHLVGVGLGPFETPAGARLARLAVRTADYVSVRDQASLDFLATSGLPAHRYGRCEDPASFLDLPSRQIDGPHLGLSVLPYHRMYAPDPDGDLRLEQRIVEVVERWFAKYPEGRVSLVCFYSSDGLSDDVGIANRIARRMNDRRVDVVDPAGQLDTCLQAYKRFSHFVSMRYHSQVLAAMFRIPQTVIAYHPKNHAFAEATGMAADGVVDMKHFVHGRNGSAFATLFNVPVGQNAPALPPTSEDRLQQLLPREAAA